MRSAVPHVFLAAEKSWALVDCYLFRNAMSQKIRAVATAIVFCAFLAYFFFANKFYPPVTLELSGHSTSEGTLNVFFDMGDGFRGYQKIPLKISAPTDAANNGFAVAAALPQVKIRALRLQLEAPVPGFSIDRAQLTHDGGTTELPLRRPDLSRAQKLAVGQLLQPRFHKGLFALHLVLAAACAWCVWLLLSLPMLTGTSDWRAALQRVFRSGQRGVFWTFFVISAACFGCWLLAYWPGQMTNDSWASLKEAQILRITDWHPYVYELYVLALWQFGQSVAAISIVQLLLTAAAGSYGFYYAWKWGVNRALLLLLFAVFATSAPIGLFNLTIWKDIPFSIAVLITALLLFRARIEREVRNRFIEVPRWTLPFLIALLIMVLQSRHNGVIFYGLLPLLLLGSLPRKTYQRFLALLAVIFVLMNIVIPRTFGILRTTASPQQQLRTAFVIITHPNFYSDDHERDIRIVEEASGIPYDRIKAMFPQQWFNLWDESLTCKHQFESTFGNTAEYNGAFVTRLSLNNLPILAASRTFEFLHSLGIDQSEYGKTLRFYQNPLQLHGSNLSPPGNFMYNVPLASEVKWEWMHDILEGYSAAGKKFEGLFSAQVLVWNLVVYFALFVAILFWERGSAAINLYILVNLVTALGVFAAGAGESWRYFYYIYLSGLLVAPLYFAYLRQVATRPVP